MASARGTWLVRLRHADGEGDTDSNPTFLSSQSCAHSSHWPAPGKPLAGSAVGHAAGWKRVEGELGGTDRMSSITDSLWEGNGCRRKRRGEPGGWRGRAVELNKLPEAQGLLHLLLLFLFS